MRLSLPLAASLLLSACAPAGSLPSPAMSAANYSAAVADARRPAADREGDVNRKPAELLTFAQVAPGEKVGDYIMGGGYITRLLATAVGPQGKVYAFMPDEFVAMRAENGTAQQTLAAQYTNVVPVRGPIVAPQFPEPLDTIITAQNLHDLYTDRAPAGHAQRTLAALHDALRPGGTLVVIDHSAAPGTGTSASGTLHRMDRQTAIEAVQAAGFVLAEEDDLYANPGDPRTVAVFDPSIRGRTDQFALRFRKPG
ncbi:class I SAM-dependent methyltransferase [Altericroceibacterium xinjiangense]|uniref:class I SAM-dependent methyltransferase n=1 Tax=Altericroceibacterium xinjiangense TaxID=762261 RepID=UPI000F7E35BF|nr:class I SAM-dependent methyltransferase [Altericroceibacterium xinjiangense]